MTTPDKDDLNMRLQTLREEQRKGDLMRSSLQQRLSELNDTMLRIEGAIQLLEELTGASPLPEESGDQGGT